MLINSFVFDVVVIGGGVGSGAIALGAFVAHAVVLDDFTAVFGDVVLRDLC